MSPRPLHRSDCAPFQDAWAAVGPLLWGLSLGMQLMLALMFCRGATELPYPLDCSCAQQLAKPERETMLYVLGCAASLALALGAVLLWRWAVSRQPTERNRFAAGSAFLTGLIGVAGMTVHLLLSTNQMQWLYVVGGAETLAADPEALRLFWPASLTLLFGLACLRPEATNRIPAWLCVLQDWCAARAQRHERRAEDPADAAAPILSAGRPWFCWTDLAVATLLLAAVTIPLQSAGLLAGRIYAAEALHHWNFFAMGPAVAFRSGLALGTAAYAQYGVGWPLLFAGLSPILPLTYGGMIFVASLQSAIYYIGMFLLLNRLLRSRLWSAAFTLLALYLGLACATTALGPWQCPSSTSMRHSLDVWYFLALLAYLRTQRVRWAAVAGALLGLGIVMETDTGFYLLATFIGCFILQVWSWARETSGGLRKRAGNLCVTFGLSTVIVLLPLLAVASRGTIWQKGFWLGWTECMRLYAGIGLGSLPMAIVPPGTLTCFILITGLLLFVIARMALRQLRRGARPEEILLTCIAAYGLMMLLLFVNRSHCWNIYHPLAPFVIVLACVACQGFGSFFGGRLSRGIPLALLLLLAVLLLSKPTVREYPGFLHNLLAPQPAPTVRAAPGLSSPGRPTLPPELTALCSRLSVLAREQRVLLAVDDDTVIYSATGLRPWSRYNPLEPLFFQPDAMPRFLQLIRSQNPDVVVLANNRSWQDVVDRCRQNLSRDYRITEQFGPYELWSRQPVSVPARQAQGGHP